MITSIFTSIIAYISTNIDDIFVIMILLEILISFLLYLSFYGPIIEGED